jgi:mannose-6-phosphate isomerase-like protein (cupin superfamily)
MSVDATNGAFILGPGEGRSIDLGNFAMSLKAEALTTAGGFSLLEASEPPNFGPPMHVHRDAAEAFYVLEGQYIVFIGSSVRECPAGSFVYVPAGVEHGFRVGPVASRKLNLYSPAAMVGYFDELSEAIGSGQATDGLLSEIAERYGMDVTGDVPEGYL